MKGTQKTKKQLANELESLKQRVTELEAVEAKYKHVKKELKQRNKIIERTVQVWENAAYPICIHDAQGNFIYANEACAKSHGYTKEALLKVNLRKLEAPDSAKLFERRMKKIREEGEAVFEVEHYHKDGSKLSFEMHTRAVELDGDLFFFSAAFDITERKRVEEKLRESESRYRYLFEHSQVANALVGLDGKILDANEVAAQLYGYDKSEIIGKALLEFVAPESLEKVAQAFAGGLVGIPPGPMEVEIATKKGERVFFFPGGYHMLFEGGKEKGFLISAIDITEQKKVDKALKYSEARYRAIVETGGAGILIGDLNGNLTFVNDSFCKIIGYSREELEGKPFAGFLHPDDKEMVMEEFARGLASPQAPYQLEFRVIHKYGRVVWICPSVAPILSGNTLTSGIAIVFDITERKKIEEALKQSEEKYRTILEEMQESYFELDLKGNYTLFNSALCRQLGYSKEEIMGINYKSTTPSDKQKEAFEVYNRIYRTGEPIQLFQGEQIKKDGTLINVEYSASPIRNDKGEIVGFRGVVRDVTERKKIEEALKQSEERYRTILEEMEDGYFEVDLAGNYTFLNEANAHQLGYSVEEARGLNYRAVIASEDIENIYKAFNQVYRKGQPVRNFTVKSVRKDGNTGLGEISVFPIRNEKGDIIGFRGIGRDITERMQMIEDLRRSEERYRTVLDEMEEAYYEIDLAGKFTFVNDALIRKSGRSREQFIGNPYQGGTAEQQERLANAFYQVYKTGRPLEDLKLKSLKPDGTFIFSEETILPLRNKAGDIIGFRGVGRDVTERRQMAEALRRSEERYSTILDEMEEAYYEVDLKGNFTFFSDALCKQLGYSREELTGLNYQAYIPRENRKKVFEVYNTVFRTGEPRKLFTSSQIKKDGTLVYTEDSIFPMRDEDGKIIGFRGISRDITERKQREEERKQREEERKQLEQKAQFASRLASVGELAAGVAHEINNPLTAVIGYAHLLLDRKDIPVDIKRDIEVINEGAQRVSGIIKKLLVFARQTKPERTYVDINEIINTTLELRGYSLRNANVKIILQLDPDLPMTVADPGQLQQVFLNLIMNSEAEVKLVHGGGKLAIKTEQVGDNLRVSFKDNGLGIAKENLERIFDPFFTTRKVGQGTGLGLSVCHGIVTEHRGRIWAESHLGKGATFIVELPIVKEKKQLELPEPVIRDARKTTKAKILVVDDELMVRQFVSQILVEEGHEVELVDSAETALEEVNNKEYQAIMLDIKMPGMSGIELYQHFQKTSPLLADRVVFITGDVMGTSTMNFLSKTKAPYVIKPFDASQLKAEINRILASG